MSDKTPDIPPTLNAAGSLSADYFDRLYAERSDPWDFETSAYESAKYAATLAAVPRTRYRHALELGCSIGVLTLALAPRCQRLVATDVSAVALAHAQARCVHQPQVTFERSDLTATFPRGRFDLILLSEVGYYLSAQDLERARQRIADALTPRGHLLLVHYTGETNYPLSADEVHDTFLAWQGRTWNRLREDRGQGYRLDLLERLE